MGNRGMSKTVQCYAAVVVLLLAASPANAGPCAQTIASVQTEVDGAIENRASLDSSKADSFNALRSYRPTRRFVASTAASNGAHLEYALDALGRARAADRAADSATCHQQLANARAALRQLRASQPEI